jgi:hypothetical protein
LRKADVGGRVARNDAFRALYRHLSLERRRIALFRRTPAVVECFALELLETTFEVDAGAATLARVRMLP